MQRDYSKAEIYIKPPAKDRKGFAVVARWNRGQENQKTETIQLPEIDSTNRLFKTGKLDFEEAKDTFERIAIRLRGNRKEKVEKPTYIKANLKILEDYFEKVYGMREIKDRNAARYRLIRAIKAMGPLRLSGASSAEIFERLRAYEPNQQKRKRIFAAVAQLLKHIGRTDVPVPRIKNMRPKIRSLSLSEFERVMEQISDPKFRLLCWAFIGTGCRPGELFALSSKSLNETRQAVFVAEAIDRVTKEAGPTKTGDQRQVPYLPEALPYLREWCNLPVAEKMAMRRQRHSALFRKAVRQAFPGDSEKSQFVFYDLRHSYAVHLLERGADLSLVARALGNSTTVCEQYYLGYVLTDKGVEVVANLLRANA